MQLEVLARTAKLPRLNATMAILSAVLLTAFAIVALALGHHVLSLHTLRFELPDNVREIIARNAWIMAPLAVSLLASLFGLLKKNAIIFVSSLLVFALLTCGVAVPFGMIITYQQRQAGFNQLACKARDDKASVAMIFAEEPSVPWFTHKPVSRLMDGTDAKRFLQKTPGPHYVLVQTSSMARLDWFQGTSTTLAQQGKWHLLDVDPH
jgi:hypothetical protein